MIKEEAYKTLKDGKSLYCPHWYFTMVRNTIYATCGELDCCEDDFDSFDEFWEWYGDKDFKVIG